MGVYIPHFLVTPPTNDLTQHDRSTVYACGVVMLYVDMSFFDIYVILCYLLKVQQNFWCTLTK